ncbi:MAG: ATP-binding cassette domain-containing protein [Chloroflexaceae bacterium]|nr:ATP-binding cassette domain-containing protein [Chloroflexaceae bacterium]
MALRGVSLSIAPGEVVGLVGRSGAGKSVLMSLLAGHMVPNTGTLAIAGRRCAGPSVRGHTVLLSSISTRCLPISLILPAISFWGARLVLRRGWAGCGCPTAARWISRRLRYCSNWMCRSVPCARRCRTCRASSASLWLSGVRWSVRRGWSLSTIRRHC